MIPALFAVLGALGLVLLLVGLRGRRVDAVPLCRSCGVDLEGALYAAHACPRCGHAITDIYHDVRYGHRQRRAGYLLAGAGVLALALAGGGTLLGIARGFDLRTIAPAWYLVHEAGRDSPAANLALDELAARITTGSLSEEHARLLVTRALQAQEDRARPWRHGWARVVASAADAGFVTADEWKRYIHNGVADTLVIQPRVRPRDRLWLRLQPEGWPAHTRARLHDPGVRAVTAEPVEVRVDDAVVALQPDSAPRATPGQWWLPPLDLKPGPHELRVTFRMSNPGRDGAGSAMTWVSSFTAPFEVRSPDQPLADLRTGAAVRHAVRAAVRLEGTRDTPDGRVALRTSIAERTVPVAFRVRLRGAGGEWIFPEPGSDPIIAGKDATPRPPLFAPADAAPSNADHPWHRLAGQEVEATLIPDPDAAARAGLAEVFGEPLVITVAMPE